MGRNACLGTELGVLTKEQRMKQHTAHLAVKYVDKQGRVKCHGSKFLKKSQSGP